MKYKGYELLKAIADGEIKRGTIFKTKEGEEIKWNGYNLIFANTNECYMSQINDIIFINDIFELIEDEIDIDSIEEIYEAENDYVSDDILEFFNEDRSAINTLIQAVKQLNKKVKELKEDK